MKLQSSLNVYKFLIGGCGGIGTSIGILTGISTANNITFVKKNLSFSEKITQSCCYASVVGSFGFIGGIMGITLGIASPIVTPLFVMLVSTSSRPQQRRSAYWSSRAAALRIRTME